jgi:hypothetical protein
MDDKRLAEIAAQVEGDSGGVGAPSAETIAELCADLHAARKQCNRLRDEARCEMCRKPLLVSEEQAAAEDIPVGSMTPVCMECWKKLVAERDALKIVVEDTGHCEAANAIARLMKDRDEAQGELQEIAELLSAHGTPLEPGCTHSGLVQNLIESEREQSDIAVSTGRENDKLIADHHRLEAACAEMRGQLSVARGCAETSEEALDEAVRRACQVHHRLEYWRNNVREDDPERERVRQVYYFAIDQLLESSLIPYIDGNLEKGKDWLKKFKNCILASAQRITHTKTPSALATDAGAPLLAVAEAAEEMERAYKTTELDSHIHLFAAFDKLQKAVRARREKK